MTPDKVFRMRELIVALFDDAPRHGRRWSASAWRRIIIALHHPLQIEIGGLRDYY